MDFYTPSRDNHGAYWYDWTTEDEIAWRNFYQVWFKLMNDYKKMGGRVTTGSDSGFIYQTYGFGYINELEMLQEAGFHPLEVIQAATMNGALTLSEPRRSRSSSASSEPGMLADLVIVDQNPLQNFKVLYGTGAVRLNDEDRQGRARRRREVDDQGRHRLRREAAARRRRGDGGEAEEGAGGKDDDPGAARRRPSVTDFAE